MTQRLVPTERTRPTMTATLRDSVPAFDADGRRCGWIKGLEIDMATGRVEALLTGQGGFLGFGQTPTPVPWRLVRHDPEVGGYVLPVAPSAMGAAHPGGGVGRRRAVRAGSADLYDPWLEPRRRPRRVVRGGASQPSIERKS